MKRTRKWLFVSQEALRLSDLGLSPKAIAEKLGLNRSTITRWMASGKLQSTRRPRRAVERPATSPTTKPPKAPAEWAKDIRAAYDLDATDNQLVTVAEQALSLALNAAESPSVRLQAAGRFQALVKQLALVARAADTTKDEPPAPPARKPVAVRDVRRPTVDPRKILSAVK